MAMLTTGGSVGNRDYFEDQGATEVADERTFVDPIKAAIGSSDQVRERLDLLADRLCGARPPTNATKTGPTAVPNGMFQELADGGRHIHDNMDRALTALSRIERALP